MPEIKGRKIVGVGFGPNIFESGQIVLRPVNPVSPPRDKQAMMPPSKVCSLKFVVRVYKYNIFFVVG